MGITTSEQLQSVLEDCLGHIDSQLIAYMPVPCLFAEQKHLHSCMVAWDSKISWQ